MMRQYQLVERVKRYNPAADEALLNKAYIYAMRAHGTQKRASGDLYFGHPLEVAAILTDLKLDDATIAAAVLHDTVEDTAATLDEIKTSFGKQIGELVDGLTKIKRLDLVSKRAAQGENFRKLLLAIAADVRVLLVKLADRLHNMRTLHFVSPEKRKRIAEETLEIYAPLAGRMGIQEMRDELEDLAFRHIHPEAYETISRRLRDLSEKSEELVDEIEKDLTRRLAAKGLTATVTGRQKHPYSIWRKMQRKSVAFEQLSDIIGFRIVVDTIDDCYRALGVVHTTWPMVPGRYKDYVSTPKQNDYRSIHTTVDRTRAPARRVADPHARHGRGRRIRHRRPRPVQGRRHATRPSSPARAAPTNGCGARSISSPRATIRKSSSSTPSSNCSTTRCSASRPRVGSSPCRAAPRRSISPMRSTPTSATAPSAARSTAAWPRS